MITPIFKRDYTDKKIRPLRIWHRGACGLAPENTLASFRKALEIGVDGVEFDAHATKDGELVLMHDDKVDRTTEGTGFIRDLTFEEIRKLDAGMKFKEKFRGERVPAMKEALQLLAGKTIFIEIKQEGIEEKVHEALKAAGMRDNVYVISFNRASVRISKEINKKIKTGLITEKPEDLQYALDLRADIFCLNHAEADREIADAVHKNKMLLNVWTMNDPQEIRQMIEIGADMLTSDFPDMLNRMLE